MATVAWHRLVALVGLGLIVVACGSGEPGPGDAACQGGPCEVSYTCGVTIVNRTASVLNRYLCVGGTGALTPPIAPGETGLAVLEGVFTCDPGAGQPCLGSGSFRVYAESSNEYYQGNVTWVPCEDNLITVDALVD